MAENREALANLNDGSNMRTGTFRASRDSSHFFCFRVLHFEIIPTSLHPAHQYICISHCKSLAATDSLLILLWNISVWIKCVCFLYAERWHNAQQVGNSYITKKHCHWLICRMINTSQATWRLNQIDNVLNTLSCRKQAVCRWSVDELVLIKRADENEEAGISFLTHKTR